MGLKEDVQEQLKGLEKEFRKFAEVELERVVNEKGDEAAKKVIEMLKAELPGAADMVLDFLAPKIVSILKQVALSQIEKISDEV